MSTPTKLVSYEDSLTMPENRLEEIVHGESRVMPPATSFHMFLIQKLAEILALQLNKREYYVVTAGGGLGIERNPLTYRIPDLAVFQKEALREARRAVGRTDPYLWAVPDLIAECLSPSNRKDPVRELLADYARIAVPEVWLLDPKPPRFDSYRHASGAMQPWQTLQSGIVTPMQLANVNVDLAELWAAFNEGEFDL
jgi:Uma2 family endonuclease